MKRITFNNLKIRNKLLLIYLSCVILPIIITDVMILYLVNHSNQERQLKDLAHAVERVEYNLRETVKGCISFTNNLYNDRLLNDFLNRDYPDNITYYDEYMAILKNNSLSYNYNSGILYKIQVIADNDTILSGGNIAKLSMVKDSEWYLAFVESGQDIFVYTYYDEEKRLIAGTGTSRTISIIRKMDYFGRDGIEKLLKIDIDYNLMLRDVQNEKIEADIYVRNHDYVLFSNQSNENGMKEYANRNVIDSSDASVVKTVRISNESWEIVAKSMDAPFWPIILENNWLSLLIVWNLILPSILIYFVGISITKRLSIVATSMDNVKKEQFEVIEGLEGEDEIGSLIRSYNLMVVKIRNLIEVVFKGKEEKQSLELSKKQAELKAIQSQVNPHFLFNTLESIRMRSLIKGEEETADIIGHLAILFRKSMDWGSDYSSIGEEISFVEKYINIQKYRFGDKIKYEYFIMDECMNYIVPKLAIATFIENACIHGIETTTKDGLITLNIFKDDEFLTIEIMDNGRGFDENKYKTIMSMIETGDSKMLYEVKSTGILNAFLRFKMYCDGNIQFHIESEVESGTKISIRMPIIYAYGKRGIER